MLSVYENEFQTSTSIRGDTLTSTTNTNTITNANTITNSNVITSKGGTDIDALIRDHQRSDIDTNDVDDNVVIGDRNDDNDGNDIDGDVDVNMVEIAPRPQYFKMLKLIGQGAFGKVILVKNRIDQSICAMKVISKKLLKKKNSVQQIKSERDILTKLHHPFLVSLLFAFQTEKKLFLIMKFLSGGELFFHLRNRGLLLEKEMRIYAAEMVLAIEFLHSKNVIHRDLKPENILLASSGHICITDFGLAKEWEEGPVRTVCGTSEYMAPEMISRSGYTSAVDWWSLGAVFYEMLVGKPPFVAKTDKELYKKIVHERVSCPSYLSADSHSLLKGMLEKDMNRRLGAAKSSMFSIGGVAALKHHAFFAGIDWHAVLRCELTPPIDLNITPTPATNPATNAALAGASDGDSELAMLSRHFLADFTQQPISQSLIEETVCSDMEGDVDDSYADFEFAQAPLRCKESELVQIEADLASKARKLEKRRAERMKREQALEAQRKEELEEMTRQQALKEQAEKIAQVKTRIAKAEKRLDSSIASRKQSELDLEGVQRKLKGLRKKLKEILTLTSSEAKLTSEQREKVSRKETIESEIEGLTAVELSLVNSLALDPASDIKSELDLLTNELTQLMPTESVITVEPVAIVTPAPAEPSTPPITNDTSAGDAAKTLKEVESSPKVASQQTIPTLSAWTTVTKSKPNADATVWRRAAEIPSAAVAPPPPQKEIAKSAKSAATSAVSSSAPTSTAPAEDEWVAVSRVKPKKK